MATQRRIEGILSGLDHYATTPGLGLDASGMRVFGQAAALIREQALPTGDYELAEAINARVPFVLPGEDVKNLTDDQIRDRLLGKTAPADPAPEEPEPEEEESPLPDLIGPAAAVTISAREEYRRRCQVDRYAVMKNICGRYGMQAHHIVPAWTLRYGTRDDTSQRISNMPSLNDGMAICVMGNAAVKDTEHNQAHFADGAIQKLGANSTPPYTATLAAVGTASANAMKAVRPDCVRQIDLAMVRKFSGKNPNQLLRAKRLPPLPQETIDALRSGASYPLP